MDQRAFKKTASGLIAMLSGGRYNATPPTLTDGQYAEIQLSSAGRLLVDAANAIANGSNVVEGSTTDVAVTGDNNGTISAKLRGLTKIFTDIWDSVNHTIKVAVMQPTTPWTVNNNPSANTTATATKAAGAAGVSHVCTSVTAALASGSTVPTVPASPVDARLRDGVAGAGTVLWLGKISIPAVAGDCRIIALSGLRIVGSPATAMTLEFVSAGGAGTFETVALEGYDIS